MSANKGDFTNSFIKLSKYTSHLIWEHIFKSDALTTYLNSFRTSEAYIRR